MTFHAPLATALGVLVLGLGLSGCVQAQGDLQQDFGASVRQNVSAQVADPDAHYRRDLPPASSGTRTVLAQDRYNKGKVIQPPVANASNVGVAGAAGGQGAGKQ